MPISVSNQAYIFLCTVAGGMLIAFVYDLLRVKRRAIKTSTAVINIEDFLYWIAVALIMFSVVYYSNEGEIRGYVFVGTVLGVVLYSLMLSRFVIKSSLFIIGIVYKVIVTTWRIISYPIKIVIKILSIPARFAKKYVTKACRATKRAGKNRIAKARVWGKILKNIRKKI
ncbi:MAG: spore cortex biosynthesis protein YabQ [Clostridia bacterium]|nr:spore cortex biosynthesis protein YabQ [Clostridia bacterium]